MTRSLLTAVLVTFLLIATRALVSGTPDHSPTDPLTAYCLLACNSLAIVMSLARCMSTWLADPSNRPGHLVARISCVLWIAGSFWTWCAWPQSSDFSSQPLWLWLQIAVVLPLPLTWISLVTPHNACLPARYLWALCTIMCGLSVWATAIYLLGVRPSIGGVDFFFYLVNARDMIEVPQEVPRISYQYFPGVFQFWRFAYRLTNGELSGLQWSYLIVLITNATLIAAIIWSMTKRLELAVLGAIWYVALLTRFEGLYGITEPIATFPLLAGIFIWQGKPLVTAPHWWRAGLLGVAIGVTVVIKQQAGLLSIATSALLLQQWLPTTARHQWRWLFALPIIAVATAFVCILLEGRGLEPLRVGFEMVSAYEPQGSFWQNLWKMVRNDESLALFAGLTLAGWCGVLVVPAFRRLYVDSDWFAVTSFCLLAVLLSCIQLRTRGYYHYALLGAPFLVIASLLLTAKLVIPRMVTARVDAITWLGFGCLLVFPLFYTGGNPYSLAIWRWNPMAIPSTKLWHTSPEISAAIQAIEPEILPGERMFLFPTRHNVIHFLLGSRSANTRGYSFRSEDIETIDWSRGQHVILVNEGTLVNEGAQVSEESQDLTSQQLLARVRRELARTHWTPTRQAGPLIVYERQDHTLPEAAITIE